MLQDILKDILNHTASLGFLDTIKVNDEAGNTNLLSIADDRSVVMYGITKKPVQDFAGTFGMPNLNKLNALFKIPEYSNNAKLSINTQDENGEAVPSGIHFQNESGDFQNDYRFMTSKIIEARMKTVKYKGSEWKVDIEPSLQSIQRFGFQASALNSVEEKTFTVKTENGNLVLEFGDKGNHAGQFTFAENVGGTLDRAWSFPVAQVSKIFGLFGDKRLMLSDSGALQITVDSGIVEYTYILPAQAK